MNSRMVAHVALLALSVLAPKTAWGQSGPGESESEALHLFILSGQSNMAGLDPRRTFTPRVTGALGQDRVLVIKDALGGAPIHRWVKDWRLQGKEPPPRRGALYDRLLKKVIRASEGKTLTSVTFLWMQGERDARMRWGEIYGKSLETLLSQLSTDLGRDDINCVIGRLSDFDMSDRRYPHWTMVRQAQMAFARDHPRRAWVDTDDLNEGLNRAGKTVANDLHYSVSGYDQLGERFAAAALRLIKSNQGPPHIVLVMADDMGWGDVGYNGHPFVKTPALDEMAKRALVFDRFYAAAPVCSPTRASVMTGRSPIRAKVADHGRYLRPQEYTLPEALKSAGYVTGLFGKFHLGSGQPDSPCNPQGMGFDEWIIGLNFFDENPYLSRMGQVERREGQGSVIAVDDALSFMRKHKDGQRPMFTVVWFPSPHVPHREGPDDDSLYDGRKHAAYYREITLLDQQVGRLRRELRQMQLAENTILWFCSDNGGLVAKTSGGRARKGSIYEGGLRVPAILEWPAGALRGRCAVPAFTCDIAPTLATLAGFSFQTSHPLDGIDLGEVLSGGVKSRQKPMGFWRGIQGGQVTRSDQILKAIMEKQAQGAPRPHNAPRMAKDVFEFPQFDANTAKGHAAWTDWPWKLHRIQGKRYELYHLGFDPMEAHDLAANPTHRSRLEAMKKNLKDWMRSVVQSLNGADYR